VIREERKTNLPSRAWPAPGSPRQTTSGLTFKFCSSLSSKHSITPLDVVSIGFDDVDTMNTRPGVVQRGAAPVPFQASALPTAVNRRV
jgi:hypothetical protein